MARYEIRDAITSCALGFDREIEECYVDTFAFEAKDDEEAVKKAEAIQDSHDEKARAVVEQNPKFSEQYENAPCYTAHLWKCAQNESEDDVQIEL